MPARSYKISGEEFTLSAGDVKLLGRFNDELKKAKNLKEATLVLDKKIYDIKLRASRLDKESDKATKKRIADVDKIKKQITDMYTRPAKEAVPKMRGKRKPMYEIDEMIASAQGMPSKAAGKKKSFAEEIKEGIGLAIGFDIENLLQAGLASSQHIMMIGQVLTKSMGLLIDLILLPFLPLIVLFLMKVVKGVVAIGLFWEKNMKPLIDALMEWLGIKKKEGAKTGVEVGAEAGKKMATPEGWGIDIPSLVAGIAGAIVGGIIGFLIGGPYAAALGAAVGSLITTTLTDFAYKLGSWAGRVAYDAGFAFMGWLRTVYDGLVRIIGGFFTFGWIGDPWKSIKDIFYNFFGFAWLGDDPLGALKDAIFNAFNYLATHIIEIITKSVANIVMPGVGGGIMKLLGFQSGGIVPGSTGSATLAVVHGGETVVPAGKSTGNITLNFYGYQDEKFVQKVKEVLRKEGARYHV